MTRTYPPFDLAGLAERLGEPLAPAAAALEALYADLDQRNQRLTQGLDLPCHRGCDACCHESVFLTPLEFMVAWGYAQAHLSPEAMARVIDEGLRLYVVHRPVIEGLLEPDSGGEAGHDGLAARLKFTCPLLGADGACSVYPARELYARLFGCSFNSQGGIYGCHEVGRHLADREVTLVSAPAVAQALSALPLTFMRQVYPYYIHALYGDG